MLNVTHLPRHCRRPAASLFTRLCGLVLLGSALPAAEPTAPPVTVQISETAPPGTSLATLGAGSTEWSWEFADPAAARWLAIDAATGRVSLAPDATLDYESQPTLACEVVAVSQAPEDPAEQLFAADLEQSGLSAAASANCVARRRVIPLVVQIRDAPEAPAWRGDSFEAMQFDLTRPLHEYTLRAVDPDDDDTLRYEIVSGNDNHCLQCEPATGRLSLSSDDLRSQLHGAAALRWTLAVRVTDSHGLAAERLVNVAVTDPTVWWARDAAVADHAPPAAATVADAAEHAVETLQAVAPAPVAAVVPVSPPAVVAAADPLESVVSLPSAEVESLANDRRGIHLVLAWGLIAVCLLGLAGVASAWLRRRQQKIAAAAHVTTDDLHDGPAILPEAVARSLAISSSPSRSLRAEMAELLAVSQHFTVTQKAHTERRFHGRQFRLAAVSTIAAGAIILLQSLFGLEVLFRQENLLVFACLCVATAAALRALFAARAAHDRIKHGGPLSGHFQLDKPSAA